MLDINLKNYKLFKRKYVLYDDNGIANEYDIFNDILLYEGEYLNGERNGKGKEYYGKNLIFEGEYLNGNRNGKGKEYYYNGKLKYDGDYLNGKRWNGNGYDGNNNKIYEIKNGKGYIKEYNFANELQFEGEYLNGERNGKGKEYYNYDDNKLLFDGEYLNGKRWNGNGYDINNNKIYEIKEGRGYIKEFDGLNYLNCEGEYINGERNGKGKDYKIIRNFIFEGEFKDGKRNGKGKEYNKKGKLLFEGDYLYGFKIKGKEYYNNDI